MPNQVSEKVQTRFTRRVVALVAIGFLALIGAGIATAWLQARNQDNARLVEHTLDVQSQVGEFTSANERIETARRGVLLRGGPQFAVRMAESAGAAEQALEKVTPLVADNPAQVARTTRLRTLLDQQRVYREWSIRASPAEIQASIRDFDTDPAVQLTREVRRVAGEMMDEERRLLLTREANQQASLRTFYWILALAGALVILVAAITLTVILRYTRELTASRIELRKLNEGLEEMVEARTAELHRANQEIQRFAYIVSHDLRSPLVNVMGFTAELDAARKTVAAHLDTLEAQSPGAVSEPVRLAVRDDLPEAIGFIRSSTQKMDRLINAILRLSREGRRTLSVEPIDMNALAQGIIDSLQHRVSDAGAEIQAERLPDIRNDRLAIEQILSNLIENAVKYLQPGRPGLIRLTGKVERDRAIFEVTDNGRGIDPRDHERIFDLFRRSGTQDQPGEGIGLAHVRALAYRLGGLIEVRSELDRGSAFRLSVPLELKPGD